MKKMESDVIIVGSGINSLDCAALLARAGRRVLVLERSEVLGGCIRTDELTLPGFLHDTLSTAHPLFMVGPAYAALGKSLHEAGLQYCNTSAPTAVVMPDGGRLILTTSREENIRRFNACMPGAGAAYVQGLGDVESQAELIFSLLGSELWRWPMAKTLAKTAWKQGAQPFTSFVGSALTPARAWLAQAFGAAPNLPAALLAPWVLHTGLGPDAPLSALMNKVVAFTLEAVGMPLVKGGNAQTVKAFVKLITQAGGELRTGSHVQQVLVENGRAVGVRLLSGEELRGNEVVCNVTPTQLYTQLLTSEQLPAEVVKQAKAYRYGKGNMQIHLALSEAPRWVSSELANVAYVHLTGGPDAVSRAVNEADRGLLPAVPTVCVAQPTALDPSRAPSGKHILWIQLPECPREILGDAVGVLQTPADGTWTESIREQYADRAIAMIERHMPNVRTATLARKVLSPADLQALNINLVGGDPYGGDCSLDQSFMWRPLRATRNHETPIKNLWHIGASTHPGPGLGGGSGFHLAQSMGAV
jgi:phytoene dehydrogenase-like protein